MASRILGLAAATILISSVFVLALSADQYAEAGSSGKKSPKHKFSKWTSKVCGVELCKENDYSRTKQYLGKSRTPR
jgi:hypothetical protein